MTLFCGHAEAPLRVKQVQTGFQAPTTNIFNFHNVENHIHFGLLFCNVFCDCSNEADMCGNFQRATWAAFLDSCGDCDKDAELQQVTSVCV